MKNYLTQFAASIQKAILISGYSRAAQELLRLSDEQLAQAGLSRSKLKKGYAGHPWKIDTASAEVINFKSNESVTTTKEDRLQQAA